MTITQFDLATIVASASSLSERLSDRLFEVDTIQINEQKLSDERLDRWCQLAAQGNWESFQRRLLWDWLDVDTVRSIIGSLPIVENRTLPSWAATLQEIIQTASEWRLETRDWGLLPLPIDPCFLTCLITCSAPVSSKERLVLAMNCCGWRTQRYCPRCQGKRI